MDRKESESKDILLTTSLNPGTIRSRYRAKRPVSSQIAIRGDGNILSSHLSQVTTPNILNDRNPMKYNIERKREPEKIENQHSVQFYENDSYLLESVKNYFSPAKVILAFTTPEHKSLLEEKLLAQNVNKSPETYFFDAEKTLSLFMKGDLPSVELFDNTIGRTVENVTKNNTGVYAFGEMVAILWAKGNRQAALKLEKLWNNLQSKFGFNLFCAYPMEILSGTESIEAFAEICTAHNEIVPSESYSGLTDFRDKQKEISLLQQKAKTLEKEIAKRKEYEFALKHTLQELRENEEFNRSIVESSADCIKVLDLNSVLLSLNHPGCKMLEVENPDNIIGSKWLDFWKGKYKKTALNAFMEARSGTVSRFQGFCPTFKGTPKWWDAVLSPVSDGNGKVQRIIVVSRDITEQKELEVRKDDFVSATSHELKTPLTSQKGYVQLLLSSIKHNNFELSRHYAIKVQEQTNKLTKLVANLLDSTRIQGGYLGLEYAEFDIVKLISEKVDEIQSLTTTHKVLFKKDGPILIYADEDRISQAVTNLLTNAIKYSPNSDKVILTLIPDRKHLTVSVRDFGIGINRKDLPRIFDKFYKAGEKNDKTFPGLGLSLYISKEIIERHGGKMWVESNKGKGSTFYFSLPLNNSKT